MERKALEMEKSRWADDQVDQMSQALNRLRAMVSLPKYSPPMPRPPTGDCNLEHQDGCTGRTFQESSLLEYPRLTPKGRVGPAGHRNHRRERITRR